ncbi:unnamed protein product [Allacma fusca]|uniref:Uncharacterized protein n=1 Tax=Allacma fusca TaxID=39272 RepID=A0A8J2PME5_9HEXA|nr:unnamed protein product [Allacma fusca]
MDLHKNPIRSNHVCLNILKNSEEGPELLTDDEIISLVDANLIQARNLEKELQDFERGVKIRYAIISNRYNMSFVAWCYFPK